MCRSNAGDVRGRTEEQSTFARYRDRRCRERSLVPSTDVRTTAGRYYNTESVAIGSGSGGRMTARVRDHARPGIWDGRYLGSVRVVCESVRTVSERMLQATSGTPASCADDPQQRTVAWARRSAGASGWEGPDCMHEIHGRCRLLPATRRNKHRRWSDVRGLSVDYWQMAPDALAGRCR